MNRLPIAVAILTALNTPIWASTPPPDSPAAIQHEAHAKGYSHVYLDGLSLYIQSFLQQERREKKPLIRFNPKLDNAFVLVQLIDKNYALYRHQWIAWNIPPVQELNALLANVFVLIPLEKGRSYITGEPLSRILGGSNYLVYKGTHPLENITGAQVSAMVFAPVSLP